MNEDKEIVFLQNGVEVRRVPLNRIFNVCRCGIKFDIIDTTYGPEVDPVIGPRSPRDIIFRHRSMVTKEWTECEAAEVRPMEIPLFWTPERFRKRSTSE